MTYLDGLGSLPQLSGYSKDSILAIKKEGAQQLELLVPFKSQVESDAPAPSNDYVKLGPFSLPIGQQQPKPHLFTLSAPTTQSNALRLARACQVPKPILLEGSPGVGKTSLVVALANITGQQLHRINLSDQTDLVDLFGSDLPVEGGRPGEFAWRDGEFLQALQLGHWVLLDEMNLAPQAVLEGLNAVLDHRGSVFIPELGRSFNCHPSFRIFAAQNPLSQGGGRKGLPKSFVNRFTKVYIEELTSDDYLLVCHHLFPDIGDEVLQAMIKFNSNINQEVVIRKMFARDGFPWEFNLRDVIRWGTLMMKQGHRGPTTYLETIYFQRFRSLKDRELARKMAQDVFGNSAITDSSPTLTLTSSLVELGHLSLPRHNFASSERCGRLLKKYLTSLESLGDCVSQSWLAIVVGGRNLGKTEFIRTMANLSGTELHEIAVNSATDTMDILGSFEQVDTRAQVDELLDTVMQLLDRVFRTAEGSQLAPATQDSIRQLRALRYHIVEGDMKAYLRQVDALLGDLASRCGVASQTLGPLHSRLSELIDSNSSAGRFEWIDGPLVKALKYGQWILLDCANLCNPSVLDRLNSLCENDGKLVLSERGFVEGRVEVITPHPNFRLFMTVDPQYGELSRAMRNRGIEITLATNDAQDDWTAVRDFLRIPALPELPLFDPPTAIAEFDAIRRGKPAPTKFSSNARASALGMLQCFSRSSGLLDQVTSLAFAGPFAEEASLPFILRTSVPGLLKLVLRYDAQTKGSLSSAIENWEQAFSLLSRDEFADSVKTIASSAKAFQQDTLITWSAKVSSSHPMLIYAG